MEKRRYMDENRLLHKQIEILQHRSTRYANKYKQVKKRVRQYEDEITQLQQALEQRESAFLATIRDKETQWMDEYDDHMAQLLRIITHHEKNEQLLKAELASLKEQVAQATEGLQEKVKDTESLTIRSKGIQAVLQPPSATQAIAPIIKSDLLLEINHDSPDPAIHDTVQVCVLYLSSHY